MENEVRICLIGTGRAGMIHAKNFSRRVNYARMEAVSDVVKESAGRAAKELGVTKLYTDFHDALNDPDIDAVVIATPTKFHCEIAVAAAEAGKHIFCEKPMAMTTDECQTMIDAANRHHVKLQLGFMRRFDASFLRAKELIDSGAIGEVVTIKSKTHGPSTPHEWMYDISKSNGPLAEVNSHDIDSLRWFAKSEAESLYAIAGNYRCPDAKETWPDFYDTVLMNVRMKNGVLGNIDGAQGVQYGYDSQVDILGVNGCITIGGLQDKTTLLYTPQGQMVGDVVKSWMNLFAEAYIAEDESFISCILNDTEPKAGGIDGKMAVAMVTAGNESITTGKIIHMEVY